MTFAIRKVINYFHHFLTLDFLLSRPFWRKVSLPVLSSENVLDLYKIANPTEKEIRAKKLKARIELLRLLTVPFLIGALVGFVLILITHSLIPFIIASSVSFFGLCLFIAAYIDGDQDYNIFMSFCNLLMSSFWTMGGFLGMALGSWLFY